MIYLPLLLLILSIILITIGYVKQTSNQCGPNIDLRVVPEINNN